MTSAENTIGTTIMKIDRRNICPIGRRRLPLTATIQGESALECSAAPSTMPRTSATNSLVCSFTSDSILAQDSVPGAASGPAPVDVLMQLKERRRNTRRDASVEHPLMARAFDCPVATSTIERAARMVPIPIDSASRGTLDDRPPNGAALARRVASVSRARCVRRKRAPAGSLNPMCPLAPMPRTSRSIPPAARWRARTARIPLEIVRGGR